MEEPKPPAAGEARAKKRPYEPPVIEEIATFETLALACGKTVNDETCAYGGGTQNS